MEANNVKTKLAFGLGRGSLYLSKHSPTILLGAGLVGMVATVVMASKATLKAQTILDEHNDQMDSVETVRTNKSEDVYSTEDYTKDKAIVYVQTGLKFAKLYGPTIGVGVLSISAILGAHGILTQRQVALAAAYNLLNEGFQTYRNRVAEEMGEEKDKQIYLGVREEQYSVKEEGENGKKKSVKKSMYVPTGGRMPSIYARCFDNSNTMFRGDRLLNRAFLVAQQNYINDVLLIRGHVFLNDVYERLGFPHTSEGQLVGWVLKSPEQMNAEGRDGYISFGLDDPITEADQQFMDGTNDAIWLDFNVDGIVYDLI